MEDISVLKASYPEAYELLRIQNIHSLVTAPMEQDGSFKGCICVDNPPAEQMRSIVPLLQTLCYFIMLTYRRTESELQLSRLSYYDTLTSFYNRNRFIKDSEELSMCGRAVGIVFLDVNGLKDINDRYGHTCGDKMLIECARQMREVFREADYYRIGGDEFVALQAVASKQEAQAKAEALVNIYHNAKRQGLCHYTISASIGVAVTIHNLDNFDSLYHNADKALYEAKENGKNQYRLYEK